MPRSDWTGERSPGDDGPARPGASPDGEDPFAHDRLDDDGATPRPHHPEQE